VVRLITLNQFFKPLIQLVNIILKVIIFNFVTNQLKMKKHLLFIVCLVTVSSFSQDTLKVMYYNLLNFPGSTPLRVDTLKTILHYDLPDVFVVNELQSNTGANSILNSALNQNGVGYYQKTAFINGPDTDNGLFYNSNKLTLLSQQQIPTVLRDINEYVLYYNDPNLSAFSDTIYFYFYSLHLKAGQGEEVQRNIELTTLKNYLNAKGYVENVFIGGDFNFYTSTEPGASTMITGFNVAMQDPANAYGNWNNNYSFREYHTQSTRTADLGDGSWGGLDDRFDFVFASTDVMDGTKGVSYIPDSYQAMGQDGLRFNNSINNPTNTILPQNIATALMYMSDHLPVKLKLAVDYITNYIDESNLSFLNLFYNYQNNTFVLNKELQQFSFSLYNLSGQKVFETSQNYSSQIFINQQLNYGIYLWQIQTNGAVKTGKIVLQ